MKFITVKMRTIILVIAALIVAATLLVLVGATRAAGLWTTGQPNRMQATYNVPAEERRVIALTFDAAGDSHNVGRIIETLKEFDVTATVFVSGIWAERHTDELVAANQAGIEIGTLGNAHVNMARLSSNIVGLELETSVRTIGGITGEEVALFRPPFGAYNDNLLTAAQEANLIPVMGNINLTESQNQTPYQIASLALTGLTAGSIIILDSNCENAVNALPAMIAGSKGAGFEFVTVGELLKNF